MGHYVSFQITMLLELLETVGFEVWGSIWIDSWWRRSVNSFKFHQPCSPGTQSVAFSIAERVTPVKSPISRTVSDRRFPKHP